MSSVCGPVIGVLFPSSCRAGCSGAERGKPGRRVECRKVSAGSGLRPPAGLPRHGAGRHREGRGAGHRADPFFHHPDELGIAGRRRQLLPPQVLEPSGQILDIRRSGASAIAWLRHAAHYNDMKFAVPDGKRRTRPKAGITLRLIGAILIYALQQF
ncbi:MAG TPA: hypothetical protein ENO19_04150 [Halothiobacillaceae bacterium]|nr:hypothetical protein [Halothiobacillaceae bacterium]